MPDRRAEIDEATAVVRWLLEAGVDGVGLTKTHALRRAVVREAAERWPHWWRHELFGPPHRESDLPVLAEVHAALRRLRLMRRQRETLLTTARGRELLADPEALVKLLHDDLGGDGFDGDAWLLIEEVLHEHGPLERDRLTEIVGRLLARRRLARRRRCAARGMGAVRCAAARAVPGRGVWARAPAPGAADGRAHGRRAAPRGGSSLPLRTPSRLRPATPRWSSTPSCSTSRGVRARLAVLERQPLTALHDAIQQAFGWYDDHLYSFWLDGSFFGSDEVELTTPDTPDEGVATADVPLVELDLHLGQRIGYVFDFGDEWRVRLTVRERVTAEPGDHPRVLELRGTPPPQYAALDDS